MDIYNTEGLLNWGNSTLLQAVGTNIRNKTSDETDYNYVGEIKGSIKNVRYV